MPMDVQVGWCNSTVHVQGFPAGRGKQSIMTSLGDITVMVLMYRVGGLYKESKLEPWGSGLGFWLQYLWLHFVRSHRPSLAATLVPLEGWNYNQKGKCSLFVQLLKSLRLS